MRGTADRLRRDQPCRFRTALELRLGTCPQYSCSSRRTAARSRKTKRQRTHANGSLGKIDDRARFHLERDLSPACLGNGASKSPIDTPGYRKPMVSAL